MKSIRRLKVRMPIRKPNPDMQGISKQNSIIFFRYGTGFTQTLDLLKSFLF
jgi:hypothetical protein